MNAYKAFMNKVYKKVINKPITESIKAFIASETKEIIKQFIFKFKESLIDSQSKEIFFSDVKVIVEEDEIYSLKVTCLPNEINDMLSSEISKGEEEYYNQEKEGE